MDNAVLRHEIPPVYNADSRVLILGSMPSVKSIEQGFYYAHPRNRFWPMVAEIAGRAVPGTVEEKRELLLSSRIAVWDVLASCTRRGSLDAAIRDAVPNDIPALLARTDIRMVFANGRTAEKYLVKFFPEISYTPLPSTSPANAGGFSPEKWLAIRNYL